MRPDLTRTGGVLRRIHFTDSDPTSFVNIGKRHSEVFVGGRRVMHIPAPTALEFATNFDTATTMGFFAVDDGVVVMKHKEGVVSMSRSAAEKLAAAFFSQYGA